MNETKSVLVARDLDHVLAFYAEKVFKKSFIICDTYIDVNKNKVIYTGYSKKEQV